MSDLVILLPALSRLATAPAAASERLATWWARGDRASAAPAGRDAALRELFRFPGTSVPVAALTRQADAQDAAGALWLRADPAHARADMTTARLLATGELGLTAEECASLLQPLKPLFGDAGFPIDAPVPQRWYLRCPSGTPLPHFAAPDAVLGDDLGLHLPAGQEGRRWRVLFNEAQVLLHQHPLNAARQRRGLPSVNALWFWGAGSLPDWVKTSLRGVLSEDAAVCALALRAGAAASHLNDSAAAECAGDALVDLAGVRDPALLERWLEYADRALRQRRHASLRLLLQSGERLRYVPAHRWRLWRRPRPLPA
jgi:hypothetical protein